MWTWTPKWNILYVISRPAIPNSRHFLSLQQCYILKSMNYYLGCNCVCLQFKFCSIKIMKCWGDFWTLFFLVLPEVCHPPACRVTTASHFLIFPFRNALKLHFDLTHQGPEKPFFLSYKCAPLLRLQALFPPLQLQNLHAHLPYLPQPIKIHETQKLFKIKTDWYKYRNRGSIMVSPF